METSGEKHTGHDTDAAASPRARWTLRHLFFLLIFGAMVPIAYMGWKDIYVHYLEKNPPGIQIIDPPRGIGLAPISFRIGLVDIESGLDEVVVRARQRGPYREVLRQSLGGEHHAQIPIEFEGDSTTIDEGLLSLQVKVFDRSLWSNSTEESLSLRVDFRKPNLEVYSTQHNARHGGSQLVFYKAYDEDLAVSGVKVGNKSFIGYPVRGIDKELDNPAVFVAVYAIDLDEDIEEVGVRVFAEDQVGNGASTPFYNKIQSRPLRKHEVRLNEEYMRRVVSDLANTYYPTLKELTRKESDSSENAPANGVAHDLVEQFTLVNEGLREWSNHQVLSLLKTSRFERLWRGPFLMQPGGTPRFNFGDKLNYTFDGEKIGSAVQLGFEFALPRNKADVVAANDGVVIFSDNLGIYGRMIGIDHGLGIVSLYGHLEQVFVAKGEKVERGQRIALGGETGLSTGTNIYYEMRVHGIPVDPREWWDTAWFYSHVDSKLNEVRRALGMPVYRELR